MALTVTQNYKDVQSRRSGKAARITVQYKRRYFDAGAVAFVYESAWRTLSMRDVVDPGDIVSQLDTTEPGIFKSSTVTLRLRNHDNRWFRSVNDPSIFAADAVATSGYYDDYTLFQILDGHRLPNGDWEDVPQFTGYAFDFTPIPKSGYVEVPISASLLAEKCGATKVNTAVTTEAVADSVTDETLNPSPGDGSTAILKTRSGNVISVTSVKADGVALTLTTQYTVSIPTDGTPATITLVSPATWNGKALTWSGVTGDLLTQSLAVASVSTLFADGSALIQGEDYTVSIATDAVGPAKITLVDATLWIGKSFTWSGTKGVINKKVEEAVALYCDAAGITSASRSIQAVLFPGGLSSSKTIDSQGDWEAGTLLQNITTVSAPGSIRRSWTLIDDFSDNDYTANPVWTVRDSGGGFGSASVSFSAASGYLAVAESGGSGFKIFALDTPWSRSTGSYRFTVNVVSFSAAGVSNGNDGQVIMFFQTAAASSTGQVTGYGLRFNLNYDAGSNNQVQLVRIDGTNTSSGAVLANLGTFTTGSHIWTVSRDGSGNFTVYRDGVSIGTATDNTYGTSAQFGVTGVISASSDSLSIRLDDIYWSDSLDNTTASSSAAAVAEYQFNLLTTPSALGRLDHFEILNGGSILLETASAPDSGGSPGTWEALQAIDGSNQMLSTPQQWLKIRVEITAASGTAASPELQKLVAHFTTSTVTLSQVAPTSGSVWDKIQALAQMCNYETGWDESGVFYFRSRSVTGDAVIAIDPWTNLVDLDDTHTGWDRVFTVGHASQTPYEYFYGSADAGEAEPTSERRFGSIPLDLDFSGELLANDSVIAKGAAQLAWEEFHLPKWRCRATIKYTSWLQMSDAVSLTYVPDPKMLDNVVGDPLQKPGAAGAVGIALAIAKKMKIVGITRQQKARTMQLLLEEILS
jgi:hypothetical protein